MEKMNEKREQINEFKQKSLEHCFRLIYRAKRKRNHSLREIYL